MTHATQLRIGGCIALLLLPAPGYAQISRELSRRIQTAPTTEVSARTAETARTDAARRAAESAAAPAGATPDRTNPAIDAAQATVPPPAAMPTLADTGISSERVVAMVPRGKLLHVRLTAVQEREVIQVLQAQLPATTQAITLPGLLRVQDESGQELKLKAFAVPGQRMVYQAATGRFLGSVKVGVMSIDDLDQNRTLTAPVPFEILETAVASPAVLRVTRTGSPFQEAAIEDKTAASTYLVHVSSSFEPNGVEVALNVSPTLLLRIERQEMQGYGLETMAVHVILMGASPSDVGSVELNADPSGFFDPKILTLDAHGNASGTLRSDGTGTVTITATAGGLTSTPATVNFRPPTRTIVAGLLGGLAGGAVRLLPKRRRGQRWGRFATGLLVAVLLGLGAFVLYAVGVNVLPIRPTVTVGTIVVIAMSFAGALMWTGKFAEPQASKTP